MDGGASTSIRGLANLVVVLLPAVLLITAALVLYSSGVWLERRVGTLRWGHVGLFGAGLAFDASGTALMTFIAGSAASRAAGVGGTLNTVMAFTGAAALALMAVHLTWAVFVLLRDRQSERSAFHRFSLAVWALWLVPYVTGAFGSAV